MGVRHKNTKGDDVKWCKDCGKSNPISFYSSTKATYCRDHMKVRGKQYSKASATSRKYGHTGILSQDAMIREKYNKLGITAKELYEIYNMGYYRIEEGVKVRPVSIIVKCGVIVDQEAFDRLPDRIKAEMPKVSENDAR